MNQQQACPREVASEERDAGLPAAFAVGRGSPVIVVEPSRARASKVHPLDGCRQRAGPRGDGAGVPAAALIDRSGLVDALIACGVDAPVAAQLVAGHAPEHIEAMLRRGRHEAEGPGWYVRAIREGYRALEAGGGGKRRYSHAGALAALEKKGYTLSPERPLDHYFAACREGGEVWFEPTAFFG